MNFGPEGLTRLRAAIELIQKLRDAQDVETQVNLALELVKLVTELTPTAADDELLATLQKFMTVGLLKELVKLVGRLTGSSVSVMSAEEQTAEIAMYQANGIGFAEAIALARMIAQLIKLAQQFRGATV
jgi:hypothetical protein